MKPTNQISLIFFMDWVILEVNRLTQFLTQYTDIFCLMDLFLGVLKKDLAIT